MTYREPVPGYLIPIYRKMIDEVDRQIAAERNAVSEEVSNG